MAKPEKSRQIPFQRLLQQSGSDVLSIFSATDVFRINTVAIVAKPTPPGYLPFFLPILLLGGCSSLPVQQPVITNPLHNYFLEIALGNEFGDNQPKIKKWNRDIHIQVKGQPTQSDIQTLKQVINELGELTRLKIRLAEKASPDIEIYFVPKSRFSGMEKNYKPGNAGFFWIWWYPLTKEIYRARILVSTTGITQRERNHLIREELTQSMGLMNDSYRHANSIFYQPWSRTTHFSEMDRSVIRLLYHPAMLPGMNKERVIRALEEIKLDSYSN